MLDEALAQLDGSLTLLSSKAIREQGRHHTLRGTVDASYELCTAGQKVLWQRLSVFAGGFDRSAAEAVCADHTVPADDVFLGVCGLVDQSVLLRTDVDGEVRYGLLETLRQYGQEHLRESGEQPWLRRRHRDYFLCLAEQADADYFGPRQIDWLRRLHTEHANLQAALEYCRTEPGEAALGLQLASALWCYWIGHGLLTEGRFWLEEMLALDTRPSRERARALWVLAWIAEVQGQPSDTLWIAQQCRHEASELGDARALAYATQFAGSAHRFLNNHAVGVALLEQAVSQHHTEESSIPSRCWRWFSSASPWPPPVTSNTPLSSLPNAEISARRTENAGPSRGRSGTWAWSTGR